MRIAILRCNRCPRLHDNPLFTAVRSGFDAVLPLYVISSSSPFSLSRNVTPSSKRVTLMLDALNNFDEKLTELNSKQSLCVLRDADPSRAFADLVETFATPDNEVEVFYDSAISKMDAAVDKEWIDLLLNVDDVDADGYVKLNPLVTTALNDDFDRYLLNDAPPKSYGKFTSIFDSLPAPPAPLGELHLCSRRLCVAQFFVNTNAYIHIHAHTLQLLSPPFLPLRLASPSTTTKRVMSLPSPSPL